MFAYLVLAIGMLPATIAFPSDYSADILRKHPFIGHGFSPYKMKTRKACLKTMPAIVSQSEAKVHLDYHIDHTKEKTEVLGEVAMGVDLILVKGKHSFKIRELFTSESLTKSLIYKASYSTKTEVAGPDLGLSELGTKMARTKDDSLIKQNCGEEYISKVYHGGTLYLAIQMSFLDILAKQEVEHKIETKTLGIKNVGKKSYYSEHALENTVVTVKAVQKGGDPEKLKSIIEKHPTKDCLLSEPEKCQKLIDVLVDYAINTESGFPSQLDKSPLRFETASYSDHGFPELSKQSPEPWPHQSQDALTNIADLLLEHSVLLHSAEQKKLNNLVRYKDRHKFETQLTDLNRNMVALKSAAKLCYQKPRQCAQIYNDAKPTLLALDHELLTLSRDPFWFCATGYQPLKADIAKLMKHFGSATCDDFADAIMGASTLDISGLGIGSVRAILPNTGLTELSASANSIRNLAPLSLAPNLHTLRLRENQLDSIAGISDHNSLRYLDLARNQVGRVAALNNLNSLRYLNIYRNPAQDNASLNRDRITVVWSLEEACAQRLVDYLEAGIITLQDIDSHPDTFPHLAVDQVVEWKPCTDLAEEL